MARRNLLFHPLAAREYETAVSWYTAKSTKIASAFEIEVERAIRLVRSNPDRFPAFGKRHRRLLLRRFPYLLVYEIVDGTIWVVAVMHGRRRPNYWARRRVPDSGL